MTWAFLSKAWFAECAKALHLKKAKGVGAVKKILVLALFVLVAGFLAVLFAVLVVALALLLLVVASSRKMMQTLRHTAKRWQTSHASQDDTTAPY